MLHPVDTYQYHFVASIMQKRYRPTWHSCAADAANLVNPPPGNPETDHGIVPSRFDHALICGPDIQNVPVLFVNALGFYLTEQVLLEYGQTQLDHFQAGPVEPIPSRAGRRRNPTELVPASLPRWFRAGIAVPRS